MQAAEKRRLEVDNLKNTRINHIIECSFDLFAQHGMDEISMNQIAKESEIGVASLYRYFKTKDDLAIECAIYAWKHETEIFKSVYTAEDFDSKTGYEQLTLLLKCFTKAINEEGVFFRFIYYFDAYVRNQNVSPERLSRYEDIISSFKKFVLSALEKGEKDGTINFKKSPNPVLAAASNSQMYFTMFHALFSMAQKLALSGDMLYMDREVEHDTQLDILINMILDSVK